MALSRGPFGGGRPPLHVFSDEEIREIFYMNGELNMSQSRIGRKLGHSQAVISSILRRRTYKDVVIDKKILAKSVENRAARLKRART